MTQQIYLNRLEKGIKIIRTYGIMIHGQQNYKTLPHYMKVFGDFCMDYLKYKTIESSATRHVEDINELLGICKANHIDVVDYVVEYSDLIEACKAAQYTDVAECIKVMSVTEEIIKGILADLNIEM